MPRTSCVLLLALAVVVATVAGASGRCHGRRNRGGILGGSVGVLPAPLEPDVVVAKPGGRGGRGDVMTITAALMRFNGSSYPASGYFVVYIREGVYEEHIVIETKNVVLVGDGREKTIITGSLSNRTGHDVQQSATLTVKGDGFMARDLCIRNTAGGPEDKQAVALFCDSDRSIFYQCDIQGFQDTLLANTKLQYYRGCRIWGTVDFVFGDAAAVFQDCELYARRPADPRQHDVITAQGREVHDGPSGFVFQSCTVAPSALPGEGLTAGVQTYLGRPWKHHALVVFIGCSIDTFVHADGWVSWSKDRKSGGGNPPAGHKGHIYYWEYGNHVRGSANKTAVHWKGFTEISREQAEKFTPHRFINGDDWIPQTGVPYQCGL